MGILLGLCLEEEGKRLILRAFVNGSNYTPQSTGQSGSNGDVDVMDKNLKLAFTVEWPTNSICNSHFLVRRSGNRLLPSPGLRK
jgi:hypothetical protein